MNVWNRINILSVEDTLLMKDLIGILLIYNLIDTLSVEDLIGVFVVDLDVDLVP